MGEQFLKRMRFHGKGRIGTVHKPRCTVTIKLEREAPHWVGTGNLAYQRHGKFDGLIKNNGSWKSWKKFPRQVEAPKKLNRRQQSRKCIRGRQITNSIQMVKF